MKVSITNHDLRMAGEKPRLLFVDNLRTLLITLVILVHLSVTYGGAGSWYYVEGRPDALSFAVLTLHNATCQSFFMGLLFLISGYFTPPSYDRKGSWQFLRDRLLRLGIPMLCYDYLINPLMIYLLMRAGVTDVRCSFAEMARRYYTEFHIGTGPLWFVETLLIYAILYTAWRLVRRPPDPNSRSDTYVPGHATFLALAVGLGILSFVARMRWPVGWAFEPLNLQIPSVPQYVAMFIIGVAAYRHKWLWRLPRRMAGPWLLLACVMVVIVLPLLFVLGGAASHRLGATLSPPDLYNRGSSLNG